MNASRVLALLVIGSVVLLGPLAAKPPVARATPKPSATPAPDATVTDPLAHWLLQQDGGKDAVALSLGEVIHATTGKSVSPFDPANTADAAFLVKLGIVMDRVLPRMNRPDSSAHAAARLGEADEIAARFEDEIRATVQDVAGLSPGDSPCRCQRPCTQLPRPAHRRCR